MTEAALILGGYLLAVATIGGVLASFLAHAFLWDLFRPSVAGSGAGVLGAGLCAAMIFGFLYALNPDPPEDDDARARAGATATMTAVSALVWLPLYLYAFCGIARRHRRGGEQVE